MDSSGVAFHPALWTTFFSAETSPSAALTGLLFVAISINLQQIVQSPPLTARAGKALATLGAVLLVSTLCLVPGQSTLSLGVEIAVCALVVWATTTRLQHKSARNNPYLSRTTRNLHMTLTQGAMLPVLLGGISLLFRRGGGLYWLVGGTLVSFLSALLDAWVLLIEIQR